MDYVGFTLFLPSGRAKIGARAKKGRGAWANFNTVECKRSIGAFFSKKRL